MGTVNRPANRSGPPNRPGSNGRGDAGVGAAAEMTDRVQLQAQTRHAQPAPQVETAEAVAC
jgi:hypothetical protein